MLEYMSVREAAEQWSVSERRIHKLCKDGRIPGLIRFGRSWGIPKSAEKPADARKFGKNITYDDSNICISGDMLGPDSRLITRNDTCAVFQIENDTGNGIITVYDVFPGIQLLYSDLHLSKIAGHDDYQARLESDMLEINHCRVGRCECEFRTGEFSYIGNGDLIIRRMSMPLKASSFPLSHYHGISIVIDISTAERTLDQVSALLGTSGIDVKTIKDELLGGNSYFLVRSSDAVEHIFSELYNTPDALKESYIRLKLIELLLFLSVAKPNGAGERQYFYRTRVNAIKAMRDYITTHLDKQFTLQELSARFNIPLTAMKDCFKATFGAPIKTYMREYRLQTAAALLRETDEAIADIAVRVGYDSHTQFTATFKSAEGMSPSDYRKFSSK